MLRRTINKRESNVTSFRIVMITVLILLVFSCNSKKERQQQAISKKPNILWIVAEDLSPYMGCYGDSINENATPTIDKLAADGVLFKRAYSTAPVCSAARSALITGVMQTTTGTHNHRSSRTKDGEIVPEELRIHLPNGIQTIPELMKAAGYFTFNSGKDDYNFHYDRTSLYGVGNAKNYKPGMNGWQGNKAEHWKSVTKDTWNSRPNKNQPWFGQIQIDGGKAKGKFVRDSEALETNEVPLPPYFPNIPSQRKAWTDHYNANRGADANIETILNQLEADGELENTIIFFFSDHGSPTSLRHKQFCYEGGMQVPLIIKGMSPALKARKVRKDLVSLLDVAATTLFFGGVDLPSYIDGQNLFSEKYIEQEFVFGARDRCDFTIDKIRTVVSKNYRYIKNYFPERAMLQASYRDNKPMVKDLKKAYQNGKLTDYQEQHWFGARPAEELYDLEADPHQINNLASNPKYKAVLRTHRTALEEWIKISEDKGQFPESVVQLEATYKLWKDRPQFKNANVNPEYEQFKK